MAKSRKPYWYSDQGIFKIQMCEKFRKLRTYVGDLEQKHRLCFQEKEYVSRKKERLSLSSYNPYHQNKEAKNWANSLLNKEISLKEYLKIVKVGHNTEEACDNKWKMNSKGLKPRFFNPKSS